METCIIGKLKINIYKTVNQFTKTLPNIYSKYLAHDTIQRLNCVMGYFNVKIKETFVEAIDLKLRGSLK